MAGKRPPAYHRYAKAHPTISVCLTEELKRATDQVRGGMSYGQFILKLLKEKEGALKTVSKRFQEDAEERLIIPCHECGEPIYLSSNQPNWGEIVRPIRNYFAFDNHLVHHPFCPRDSDKYKESLKVLEEKGH